MLLGTLLAAAALRRGLVLTAELFRGGGAPRLPGTRGSVAELRLKVGFNPSVFLFFVNSFGISGNKALVAASKVEGDIRLAPSAGIMPPRGT